MGYCGCLSGAEPIYHDTATPRGRCSPGDSNKEAVARQWTYTATDANMQVCLHASGLKDTEEQSITSWYVQVHICSVTVIQTGIHLYRGHRCSSLYLSPHDIQYSRELSDTHNFAAYVQSMHICVKKEPEQHDRTGKTEGNPEGMRDFLRYELIPSQSTNSVTDETFRVE